MTVDKTDFRSATIRKRNWLGLLSATPLMLAILGGIAAPAFAQQVIETAAEDEAADAAGGNSDILVTGTRVLRNGYEAPTPVTVVSIEQLRTFGSSNVADSLNTLPQFSGSSTPLSTAGGINNHQGGINGLSLRGLGTIRTLVLLNGKRIVGNISTGVVDTNQIPQQLIKRVDTVFGGASAEYGSDALTGVINFVLDNKFTGLKGEVSGGMTTYGDDFDRKFSLTGGTSFAGGRGHLILSGEIAANDGILSPNPRSWNRQGHMMMNNPAYGTGAGQSTSVPQYIARSQVGMSNAAPGGLITTGPLRGTLFGQGGSFTTINFGSIISDPLMSGGDWEATHQARVFGIALNPEQSRRNIFGRLSFEVSDNVEVYGQAQYANAKEVSNSVANYMTGNLTVTADNPYIPTAIAQSMADQGITSFRMGTMNYDMGGTTPTYDRSVIRLLLGATGTFDAFGSAWNWDVHGSYGRHEGDSSARNTFKPANYARAIDAVRSPTGTIVCRSTLTDPANGCVPYNLFGTGVNSTAAINYVQGGVPWYSEYYEQTVGGANLSGEPVSLWAGPVSFATGIEYRKEKTDATSDPGQPLGEWFISSGVPFAGQFSIIEGYVATVVPLAKDMPWAQNLEVSAAARVTNYSTFGTKATWKVGVNYSPFDDLRFRGSLSRDLREPTMVDLYAAPVTATFQISNPFYNNQNVNYQGVTVGNRDLQPESALSAGLGLVYQPSWLPRFSISFDYYNIHIKSAITSFSAGQLLNLCYEGQATACSAITEIGQEGNGLPILRIVSGPQNFSSEKAKGFDIEASYALSLDEIFDGGKGELSFRVLATHAISNVQESGAPGTIAQELAGQNIGSAVPKWKYQANMSYHLDPVMLGLSMRGVSSGTYNNNWITCTTECPKSTANNITTDMNYMPAAVYFDFNARYDIHTGGDSKIELFFNIRNLANKQPPVYYPGPNNNSWQRYPADPGNYDILGRIFRAGLRFAI